jgi:endonuclease/exonuclease/phosphatase family metal-dependent hydrolase
VRRIAVVLGFLTTAACGAQDGATGPDGSPIVPGPDAGATIDPPLGDGRVRVMAANTTAGTAQSYTVEGIRLFQGLHPDVVLIQEFNYGDDSDATIRGFVDTTFGTDYGYFRESGQIPNGIVTRFPILESGSWSDNSVSNRGFAWARINLPGPKDLWAISVHLLTTSSVDRATEATQLASLIQSHVPVGDYVVVGGDFNTGTRTEACVTALAQVVSTVAPYPVDNAGNDNTSEARTKPHDWVLASTNFRALQTPVVIGAQSFANGLVVDSRVYTPLVDLAPVMAGDSGVSGMQHMPVVQDFDLAGI